MTARFGWTARAAAVAITLVISCVSATAPGHSQSVPSAGCPRGYSGSGYIGDGDRTAIERFRPVQAIRYVLGSKRVVGYFVDADGECRVTLMITEEVDATVSEPPSAARLVLAMRPGQSASLDSAEAEAMLLTCQGAADAVEVTVRRRNLMAAERRAVER